MRMSLPYPSTWLCTLLLSLQALFVTQTCAETATIDWANVHQRIDGFGASSAFDTIKPGDLDNHFQPAIDDPKTQIPVSDFIFDPQKGLGISLLRTGLKATEPEPDDLIQLTQFDVMSKAIKYGVRVWSTPWTPPASLKNTGIVGSGGFLLRSNYDAYAQRLAKYVRHLHAKNVDLYAISIQNEPNFNANYESCIWSAQEFHDFVPYLHRALEANRTPDVPSMPIPKIILPEKGDWSFELATTTIRDPATIDMVGILAGHNYGTDPLNDIAPVITNGKALWETETCSERATIVDSYLNGMEWAERVHTFLVKGQVNAFHYWWINAPASSKSDGLFTDWTVRPLAYTIGHFSRFIRPGYYRISATNSATDSTAALISAYKDPISKNFSIVAVNKTSSAISQTFSFTNAPALSEVTPWMTTSEMSMMIKQPAVSMGAGNSFTYNLPAKSVVTFVGKGLTAFNTAPTVSLGSSVFINSPLVNPTNIVRHFIGEIGDDGLPSKGSVTKAWTKVSGPAVTFSSSLERETDVTFSTAGNYVIRLTATDGALSSFADLNVKVVGKSTEADPRVEAGPDLTAIAGEEIALKGIITDPDLPPGSVVAHKWTQISGPGDTINRRLFIFDSKSLETKVRFQMAGTYILRLSYERPTTAGQGTLSISDDVEVKVTQNGPRLPPFVYPGNPTTTLMLPINELQLYGVITYDGTTDPSWSKMSGPGTVSFSDANKILSKATFSTIGTYVLRLTGTPTDGSQPGFADRTVSLMSTTRKLTVFAGPDQTVAITSPAALKCTVSELGLPAGGKVNATWSKISGSGVVTFAQANFPSTAANTTATFGAAGVYVLRLTVSDGTFTVYDETTVTVTSTIPPPNAAPTVATAAKATPNPVLDTTTVLSVLGADDGGENNLRYTWATSGTPPAPVTFSVNNSNAAKSTTATFTKPGAYVFTVTMTDAGGKSVTSTVNVTVTRVLDVLTVSPGSASVVVGGTQTFSASGVDQFGVAISVNPTWSVSGGGTISSTTGVFTAGTTSGGPFTVTATDGSASDTSAVTVTPAPKIPPTIATAATATPSPVIGTSTTLSVLGADDGGEANLIYHWDTTGTPPAAVTFANNDTNAAKSTSVTFTQAGTYAFTVTIRDLDNRTASSSVSVRVNQTIRATVTPASPTTPIGGTQRFTAQAIDQFDDPMLPAPTWTWSVAGGGSISAAGLFTAGSTAGGPYTVTATSGSVSATASVSVVATIDDRTPPATPGAPTVTGNNTVAPTVSGTTEANATINVLVDGVQAFTVAADASGAWSVKLTGLTRGAHQITVTATDAAGNTSGVSLSATATVTLPNQRPVAAAQNVTTAEDTAANITLSGTDGDGTIATYTYLQPAHGTVSGSGANVTYTPDADYFGDDSFSFTVTDNRGLVSAPATVSMAITSVNDAPTVLKAIVPTPATVGVRYNYIFDAATTFSDAESDPLTYTASGLPPGLTFSPAKKSIAGTPTTPGVSRVTITANDGHLGTADASFDLTVTSASDTTAPPTPVAPNLTGGNTTTPTISGNTEPNATITIRVDGVAVATTTADSAGHWTSTLTNPPAGTHLITVIATDASGNASGVSPAVTVNIPSNPPGGGSTSAGGGGGGCGLGSGSAGLMAIFACITLWLRLRRRGFQAGS